MYVKIHRRSSSPQALPSDAYERCAADARVLLKLWSMAGEAQERAWELLPHRDGACCAEARIGVQRPDPRAAYADLAELARGHGFELEFVTRLEGAAAQDRQASG